MIELEARFTFGANGSARQFLKEGWSILEDDFSWTEGQHSRMVLPFTPFDGDLVIEISLNPMLMPPVFRRQRLVLAINGEEIADDYLAGECALGFEVPARALAAASALDIRLHCPDAISPASIAANPDPRQLGVAVRELLLFKTPRRPPFAPRLRPPLPAGPDTVVPAVQGLTGLPMAELAACFESLGHNCEFGLAQRQMGREVLGLIRFGGISVQKLVEGLDHSFDGIDAPGNLLTYVSEPDPEDDKSLGEFMVRDRRYGINFHSEKGAQETTADAVLTTFYRNMTFLKRMFTENLASGDKIFVFQHPTARSVVHIRPILNLLRSHGPNSLLFVTDDKRQAAGSVEQLDDDLFQGWVSKLAPTYNVRRLDLPSWISICANTYRLWRETGRQG